jgi:shikimate kinase
MSDFDQQTKLEASPSVTTIVQALGQRSVVLVGMMGAGKTNIGKKLAERLCLPFIDADKKIEEEARMSISDLFQKYGETSFRAGETRVVTKLLNGGPQILATGGGAFMSSATRATIRAKGISIWLKADLEVLLRRVKSNNDRPLLIGQDARKILKRLIAERHPVYTKADIIVETYPMSRDKVVEEVLSKLRNLL